MKSISVESVVITPKSRFRRNWSGKNSPVVSVSSAESCKTSVVVSETDVNTVVGDTHGEMCNLLSTLRARSVRTLSQAGVAQDDIDNVMADVDMAVTLAGDGVNMNVISSDGTPMISKMTTHGSPDASSNE